MTDIQHLISNFNRLIPLDKQPLSSSHTPDRFLHYFINENFPLCCSILASLSFIREKEKHRIWELSPHSGGIFLEVLMLLAVMIKLMKVVWSEVAHLVITMLWSEPCCSLVSEHQPASGRRGKGHSPNCSVSSELGPEFKKDGAPATPVKITARQNAWDVGRPKPWCPDFFCSDHSKMVNAYEQSAWSGLLPVMEEKCSALSVHAPPRSSRAL